ncbi:MAG: hypothetical protein IPO92_24205 [Saprospiraceae bacterium]|nr:hypothetical protein [Saprospiraceae bacterium]
MKIRFNKITFIAILVSCFVMSCSEEATDISTVTKFEEFSVLGLPDKIELPETDSVYTFNFTFDEKQIVEFTLDIAHEAKSTATEDVDYALPSHSVSVATLQRAGSFQLQINSDVFLEGDESIFITLTSNYPLGLPLKKTMEVVIKNVGGCPEYVHSDFVGDYTVVSDGWADWSVGSTISVADEGSNVLSFKYNCGANAKPILLNVDPETFGIFGTKQEYCSYDLPPLTVFLGDIDEAASAVNTCEKSISVTIVHSDANGTSYGPATIVLKKK